MGFTTASLANNGHTTHYDISYAENPSGVARDLAQGLLAHCEDDFALMASWFPGVGFRFSFPISVQIVADLPVNGGARWVDPPDGVASTFHPNVEIDVTNAASVGHIRSVVVSEVTEMFMASQGQFWHLPSTFAGSSEGSMGESLSRFLSAQFLRISGIGPAGVMRSDVVWLWLNMAGRPDFVTPPGTNNAADLRMAGCGTCFLFFLSDQLNFTIQQIVGASAPSLAGVYTNLTGKTDGSTRFRNLVDAHYPLDGTSYDPPLETVFPVADLYQFLPPQEISWVANNNSNFAWLFLTHPIPVEVGIALSSDNPSVLSVPAGIMTSSFKQVFLAVPPQPASFQDTIVNLSATYAGTTITKQVRVARPENLTLPPLQITPLLGNEPCVAQFIEKTAQVFQVTNLGVFADQTSLTYRWKVSGAHIAVNDQPALTIPHLPAAGTQVTVSVTVTNGVNIRGVGKYTFTTVGSAAGATQHIQMLDCSLQNLRAANLAVPPWIPVEQGKMQLDNERLAAIRNQAQRIAAAAQKVIAAVNAMNVVDKTPAAESPRQMARLRKGEAAG